jgi:hypothetical protein
MSASVIVNTGLPSRRSPQDLPTSARRLQREDRAFITPFVYRENSGVEANDQRFRDPGTGNGRVVPARRVRTLRSGSPQIRIVLSRRRFGVRDQAPRRLLRFARATRSLEAAMHGLAAVGRTSCALLVSQVPVRQSPGAIGTTSP